MMSLKHLFNYWQLWPVIQTIFQSYHDWDYYRVCQYDGPRNILLLSGNSFSCTFWAFNSLIAVLVDIPTGPDQVPGPYFRLEMQE